MKAAFYECDVTPPLGGFIWGYYKERYACDVIKRLYSKAVVIKNDESVVAILTIDTCVIPEEMHEIVTKRIFEFTGIRPESVCISSNHTHLGAPVTDGAEVGCYADKAYKDVFFRLCADAVILAYNRLEEVKLSFVEPTINGISYCRNYELEDGTLITHGRGRTNIKRALSEPDRAFPIIYFYGKNGILGTISSFACHQDTMGGTYDVCGYAGDYASVLSDELKAHYGHNFVSIFLLGCCGDINTANLTPDSFRYRYNHIGKELADSVIKNEGNATKMINKLSVVKESVRIERRGIKDLTEANKQLAELFHSNNTMVARNMLYYVSTNKADYSDLFVQGILLGEVYISLLPGEIYTNISRSIKANSPFEKNIVVENCNSYCGYIPSEEVFTEKCNLYEASLCYHSCHVPEAASILKNKSIELAKKLKQERYSK